MTRSWWLGGGLGLIVLALAGLFVALGLDRADQTASVVAALAGVAGLGLSGWALLPARRGGGGRGGGSVRVADTGDLRQRGGTGNTGYEGAGRPDSITVERTGDIDQEGGGSANTGARVD